METDDFAIGPTTERMEPVAAIAPAPREEPGVDERQEEQQERSKRKQAAESPAEGEVSPEGVGESEKPPHRIDSLA